MKNRILFAIALLLCIPNMVWAQDASEDLNETIQTFTPITTGVSFLTVAPDARGGGLGDVGAATAPDADAQYWNPAKYAFINAEGGATVSYVPWLRKLVSDIDLVSASGYYKIQDVQTVAASPAAKAAVEAPKAAAPAPAKPTANGEKVLSPFPGLIKNLLVAEGASVKKDQPILVLEAMKMDNDITAPCDGTVSFQVVKGANVESDSVLAVIS